jgi:hypothetical protein
MYSMNSVCDTNSVAVTPPINRAASDVSSPIAVTARHMHFCAVMPTASAEEHRTISEKRLQH